MPNRCLKAAGSCWRVATSGAPVTTTLPSFLAAATRASQSAGVPAWQRDGPLLYAGDALLFVPGLGIDARQWADAGVPQLHLRWECTAH